MATGGYERLMLEWATSGFVSTGMTMGGEYVDVVTNLESSKESSAWQEHVMMVEPRFELEIVYKMRWWSAYWDEVVWTCFLMEFYLCGQDGARDEMLKTFARPGEVSVVSSKRC